MASNKISDAHIILQHQFLQSKPLFEKDNKGVTVFITASYRSKEEQTALFNQPWDKKDNNGNGIIDEKSEKVTNAKAGQSAHNYLPSFAIDVAFKVNGKVDWSDKYFKLFSKYMKNEKIEWGGDWKSFKDFPHFEIKNWRVNI